MSGDICPCCEAKQRAELVAREWERQSKEWENIAKLQRSVLEHTGDTIDAQRLEIAALERRLAEAQQGLTVAEGG